MCIFCSMEKNLKKELSKKDIAQIESFINDIMKKSGVVPGLGVAIVKDDQIVYTHGFGFRDLEKQLPVTTNTGFYIASKTKSFTGMAAAMLENKGKIDLNATLASFYPDLELTPPLDANKIRLVDLLSHQHGINNSGIQYQSAFIDQLSHEDHDRILYDFSTAGRPGFSYSNLGYNILSTILEKQFKEPWQEIVEIEVLQPIDMDNTTPYMSEAIKKEIALPYLWKQNGQKLLPLKSDGQMQSAGGIVSSPEDLAKWLLVNMNNGQLGEKQVIPSEVIQRVQKPHVTLDRDYFLFHRYAYGLGWYRSNYESDTLIHHFGSFDGYMAHVSFMPNKKIGVVALSNELDHGARLPHIVAAYIYDYLLGKENLDTKYQEIIQKWLEDVDKHKERSTKFLSRKDEMLEKAASNPDHWNFQPKSFTGTYHNPRLGHFTAYLNSDGQLWARYGTYDAPLLPLKKDVFLIDWPIGEYISPPTELKVSYYISGEVAALNWESREFRLLPMETAPTDLNVVYSEIRRTLKEATLIHEDEQHEKVRNTLEKYYSSCAINEPYINYLGYYYLAKKEFTIAITLFQFNTDYYPDSSNAYDSLGEAYMMSGKKQLAKLNFKKSLEIDPNNSNAVKMLEKL